MDECTRSLVLNVQKKKDLLCDLGLYFPSAKKEATIQSNSKAKFIYIHAQTKLPICKSPCVLIKQRIDQNMAISF